MSQSNTTQAAAAVTIPATIQGVATVAHTATFMYKNYKEGDAGFDRLSEMLDKGIIAQDDIIITEPEAGTYKTDAEKAKLTQYRRATKQMDIPVPLVTDFVKDDTLAAAQLEHLQGLINKACEEFHKKPVADGDYTVHGWDVVLNESFATRGGQVKVTPEMVKDAVESLNTYLVAAGTKEKGVQLVCELAGKKFNAASLQRVPVTVLENVQTLVGNWFESLEATEQHQHTPVMSLYATALEKALKPSEEIDLDMF